MKWKLKHRTYTYNIYVYNRVHHSSHCIPVRCVRRLIEIAAACKVCTTHARTNNGGTENTGGGGSEGSAAGPAEIYRDSELTKDNNIYLCIYIYMYMVGQVVKGQAYDEINNFRATGHEPWGLSCLTRCYTAAMVRTGPRSPLLYMYRGVYIIYTHIYVYV